MPIKSKYFIFLLFCFSINARLSAQDSRLEKLEQLYNQGYYKMVYRRAGKLLMNPAYDQSKAPLKYRQLAIQELAKDPRWAKKHALEIEWMEKPSDRVAARRQLGSAQTQQLLNTATQLAGVPYKAAGTDPSGFDCSGFTSYVYAKQGIILPRRAVEQYNFAQKITAEEAQYGDLVFFSNGGEINHVGILISEKGAPKQMIHASSSVGISIADIETSAYWKDRVVGYGRVAL
ncbi:MAG: C40 family peptidase [Flavobacteriales bacterium]